MPIVSPGSSPCNQYGWSITIMASSSPGGAPVKKDRTVHTAEGAIPVGTTARSNGCAISPAVASASSWSSISAESSAGTSAWQGKSAMAGWPGIQPSPNGSPLHWPALPQFNHPVYCLGTGAGLENGQRSVKDMPAGHAGPVTAASTRRHRH